MVLETPHGLALLIDGGGSVVGDFDPGREIVVPFLESRGIRKLTALTLTHPHPDHANGLPAVLRSFEVGELWESGEPCPLPACEQIAALERTRGTRHLSLGTGRFVRDLDGVDLVLRSPRLPEGYDRELGPNDNSRVFGLTYGKCTALLTGDIEATAEARLVASGVELGAFLLKAPHHGSDTSSTQAFVDRVHPRAVVFSVGPRNRFNFPRPEVSDRYQRIGAQSYRTDRQGAVTVETDGEQVWITSAASRRSAVHGDQAVIPSAGPPKRGRLTREAFGRLAGCKPVSGLLVPASSQAHRVGAQRPPVLATELAAVSVTYTEAMAGIRSTKGN